MATKKNVCCVCRQPFERAVNLVNDCPACPTCKPVWHICFTSAEEGVRAAKSADTEVLQRAFLFEQRRAWSRKTLRVAIVREISKRIKAAKTR